MIKVAIFASGTGTNFHNIISDTTLNIECVLFVCDNPKAKSIGIATEKCIPHFIFNPKDYDKKTDYEKEIIYLLEKHKVQLIILAGYMRLLSPDFTSRYDKKIINIHPSLLPLYKGGKAIPQAYADGKNIFGVTVHYVNEEMDSGEIILQEKLHNTEKLTLEEVEEKIHQLEYKLYPMAIKKVLEQNYSIKRS